VAVWHRRVATVAALLLVPHLVLVTSALHVLGFVLLAIGTALYAAGMSSVKAVKLSMKLDGRRMGTRSKAVSKSTVIGPNPTASGQPAHGGSERRDWRKHAKKQAGGLVSRPALQAGGRRFDPCTAHQESGPSEELRGSRVAAVAAASSSGGS
jgi:uncharacterized membrane protein